MRKMTLIQRFSLVSLVAIVLFGVVFGWVITTSLERNMLMWSKQMAASIVSDEVKKEFTVADFVTPKTGPDYDVFSERMGRLSFGPEVERIKVWNRDKVIVWSDEQQLVGQRFPDNEELIEALDGEIVSEISLLNKTEQQFERQFERLLELYIPIRFEAQGEVGAVFEIYSNLDPLYAEISRHKQKIWTLTFLGFAVLYGALFGIVWRASGRIEAQTREIVQSEERYRSLIRAAQDGIISVDRHGKVILFNEAALQMFGYSAGEMMGQPLHKLIPEQYWEHQFGTSRFPRASEIPLPEHSIEAKGLRKNGESFPLELSLSVSGETDDPMVTMIIRDISVRKAMQQQLVEVEKQASVSLIAGSIGHEINNTISGLAGYAKLLMRKPDDGKLARKCAEIFAAQSQRLGLHAHNLLTLSKPREPAMKPIVINSLLRKVTELLVVSGLLKAYTIVEEYAEDLPPVLGDEVLLEQVIRNLEINAAQAMEGQGILTLTTKLSPDRFHVEFSIGDTGYGIPDDKRDQIFLPFYTTKGEGKGTGLGMYIVKQIVEQHKGYLRLESEVGVGTTVTIGLPVL